VDGLGARCGCAVVGSVCDAELRSVLELAGGVDDKLDAVVRALGLQAGGWCPLVFTGVGEVLDKWADDFHVVGGAVEEDQGDGARGGRFPCYLVWLASGDSFIETGLGDGVAEMFLMCT